MIAFVIGTPGETKETIRETGVLAHTQQIVKRGKFMGKILGVIPARGGSKRLKDKNILQLKNKPLIGYTIEAALASKLIDRVVVSTECDRIAKIVRELYDVEIIKRPVEYAKDDSLIEESLLHTVEYLRQTDGYDADIVVWMHANLPIRREGIVDEVVQKLIDLNADSCVTCYVAEEIPEVMKAIDERGRIVPLYKNVKAIQTQEFPERYLLDGSVVAMRAENLFKTRGIREAHIYLGKEVVPVMQDKKMHTLEIDTAEDFSLANYYMEQLEKEEK